MWIRRRPVLALRPFVDTVWALDEDEAPRGERERVLPTGAMHVVFRLSETPLYVYGQGAEAAREVGCSIVGGARSSFYVRDVSRPVRSVGAQLLPGASALLLGVPAGALAEAHTSLEDLWGRRASDARARIAEAGPLERQLAAFEALLLSRFPRVRAIHPAVAEALALFAGGAPVGEAAARSGLSHRRFIEIFRDAVGLAPKVFARVTRFQRALDRLSADARASPSHVALDTGYSDQPHMNRDFRAFAGIPPGLYARLATASANHVPSDPRGGQIRPRPERRGGA